MKARILQFLPAILILTSVAAGQNKYTGAKLCAACHKSGKGGTSYAVWEKSGHAKAFQTLLGEDAKRIAKEKGIKGPPSESPACLKCHVTGGGEAKNVEATFKKEEGVTCETCHGAASAYKMLHSKGDKEKSKAAGLMIVEKTAKFCETCHNPESPTFKPFKFDERWQKIAHELPAKK